MTGFLHAYGYCPVCGAGTKYRERRLGGNDTCENGHVYPSRDSVKRPPDNIERIQVAAVDPDSPMYGSACAVWVLDVCCHVKALLAENARLREVR